MDAASLRSLSAAGVAIGSHGWSHARLTQLTSARVTAELRDSKARLEDALGHAVTDFCYPYGSHDARVIDLTRDAGYRLALTCVRGAANAAPSAFEIPRKAISHGDNALTLLWKLHTRHTPKPHQFKVPAAP